MPLSGKERLTPARQRTGLARFDSGLLEAGKPEEFFRACRPLRAPGRADPKSPIEFAAGAGTSRPAVPARLRLSCARQK